MIKKLHSFRHKTWTNRQLFINMLHLQLLVSNGYDFNAQLKSNNLPILSLAVPFVQTFIKETQTKAEKTIATSQLLSAYIANDPVLITLRYIAPNFVKPSPEDVCLIEQHMLSQVDKDQDFRLNERSYTPNWDVVPKVEAYSQIINQ